MIADGYTGRKGKGGFYRLNTDGGQRIKESINLNTLDYQTSVKPKLDSIEAAKTSGLQALFNHDSDTARYAWRVMSKTLTYAASLIPEISGDIVAVDSAMKLGYSWQYGPFELLDKIGVPWFVERLKTEAIITPPPLLQQNQSFYKVKDNKLNYLNLKGNYQALTRNKGVVLLADYKLQNPALLENPSASLWDVGDGVARSEEHTSELQSRRNIVCRPRLEKKKTRNYDHIIQR